MKQFTCFARMTNTTYLKELESGGRTYYYASGDGLAWHRVSRRTHADLNAHNRELRAMRQAMRQKCSG